MLTDTELRNLQPRTKPYKITDRDGMYVVVSPAGTVSFRYDYRINGRRETLTIGRYGRDGISLANARERLSDSRRAVSQGRSPAIEMQREKRRLARARTFGEFAAQWLKDARMADTTRSMRKSILERDIKPVFESRLLCEISADDLRALCQTIKGRGAPATAVHARDIVKQIYAFANLHGEKVPNPADDVAAASIATFVPKDRALSPAEIGLMHRCMETVATYPTTRLALRMILLTLARKSELIQATWDEVDFEAGVWIPKSRMKARRPHNVYLSQQALDNTGKQPLQRIQRWAFPWMQCHDVAVRSACAGAPSIGTMPGGRVSARLEERPGTASGFRQKRRNLVRQSATSVSSQVNRAATLGC